MTIFIADNGAVTRADACSAGGGVGAGQADPSGKAGAIRGP